MRKVILLLIILSGVGISIDCKATVYPKSLKKGDKIAILAPSGNVKREYVDAAGEVISSLGYEPVIYDTAYGKYHYLSGTREERFSDLESAFADTTIRAILCARGGYGAVHNLDSLAALPLNDDPKWLIGFSDISALHGLMASKGIASIHSSMASGLSKGMDNEDNKTLFEILEGKFPTYTFEPDPRNHPGVASGKLLGGNLAVIQALIATPYNLIKPGTILFIEDVSEPVYKVERMLYQLRMAGIIPKLKGIIIGQFTDYKEDDRFNKMEDMIAEALADYPDLPVAFNVPVGHVSHNVPFVESSFATLEVTPDSVTLSMQQK